MSTKVANDTNPGVEEEEEEDMSIESEAEEEVRDPGVNGIEPLPMIQLSFDTSKGGAWDDRELVHAYDAAMEEFHVHHPGPGSWLDKATAALAKGQPLPGAINHGTAWYEASRDIAPAEPVAAGPSTNPSPFKRIRKEKRRTQDEPFRPNPYAPGPPAHQPTPLDRRHSPSYAPGSPLNQAKAPDWSQTNGHSNHRDHPSGGLYDSANGYDQPDGSANLLGSARPGPLASNPASLLGVQPTDQVSADDALSYAMTAQYWAGYWMGVSRVKAVPSTTRYPESAREPQHGQSGAEDGGRSNVFVTRQQFHRPNQDGLRR